MKNKDQVSRRRTMWIDDSLWDKIKILSKKEDRSVSGWIRNAIRIIMNMDDVKMGKDRY